jgi:hypothetical protein
MWVGWYRRTGSSPWRRAVEAGTVGECSRALDAFLNENKVRLHSNLDVCLTRGNVPTIPPRRAGHAHDLDAQGG